MASKHNLYPHMIVGNIQKIANVIITNNVINYTLAPSQFISDLIDLKENGNLLADFITSAQTYIEQNANAITKKSELLTIFPQYDVIVEALSSKDTNYFTNLDTATFNVISHESRFWENAIAYFIYNKKASFINDLINSVKLIGLLKKIQDNTLDNPQKIFDFWDKSYLLYPSSIFPLPKKAIEIPAIPVPPQTITIEELIAKRDAHISARKELLSSFKTQNQVFHGSKISKEDFEEFIKQSANEDKLRDNNIKNEVVIDIDKEYEKYLKQPYFYDLSKENVANLSKETLDILKKLNFKEENLNVVNALSAIDDQISTYGIEISQNVKPNQLVLIGTTLIEVNNSVYEDVLCREQERLTHCELIKKLIAETPDKNYVQILGMGNYNVIEQKLIKYEADEIAHIENILKGESKEKTHRNLKIKEEYYSSESETSEETETDVKTSDRFELSKEINSIVSQSTQFEAGVSLSVGYGPVALTANVGYATASSNTEATSTAVNNAKEITERATQSIQKRIIEKRSVTTINEVEITNLHKIDNSNGTEHINGFYYWVDKVYKNQIKNLGKRLMLEFLIPEPAAYHIYSNAFSKKEGVVIDKPINPKVYTDANLVESLATFGNINRENYKFWAALYNVIDIPTPPLEFTHVSKAYSLDYTPGGKCWYDKDYNDLLIPEGYEAKTAKLSIAFSSGSGRYIQGHIGNKYFSTYFSCNKTIGLDNISTNVLPFSFRGHFDEYAINIGIECALSSKGYEKWQKEAYSSIINAYNTLKAEYDNAIAGMETSVSISGNNPVENRIIEKTELKKWAIELLTLQRFEGFNAMQRAIDGTPEIDFNEALNEGTFIKFFEQSIEWGNMTYLFYPYYWSKRERWSTIRQLGDTDYSFSEFLKAGYARVVVPVSSKFTEAILHYLNTGEIWMGETLPALDDDLYISIVEEIAQSENNSDGELVGESWETRIPTNMVVLREEIPNDLLGSGD